MGYRILPGVRAVGSREVCEKPLSFTKNQAVTEVKSRSTENQFRTPRSRSSNFEAIEIIVSPAKYRHSPRFAAKPRHCKISPYLTGAVIVGIQLQ
jgi:hypothetical protein